MKTIILSFLLFAFYTSFADEKVEPLLDCCSQNLKKQQEQIKIQNEINSKLNNLVLLANQTDTVVNKVEVFLQKEKNESDCNFCGILGSALGAIISAVVALLIYMSGGWKEQKKKKKEINEFGESISYLLKDVSHGINTQVKEFERFLNDTKDKKHLANVLKKIPLHQIDRLRSFDTEKIFKLIKNLKIETSFYHRFYNNIDFLSEMLSSVRYDIDETNEKFVTPLSNEFLKQRSEILETMADLTRVPKPEDDFYNALNETFLDYFAEPEKVKSPDIDYDYKTLIIPLLEKVVISFRENEASHNLLKKLKRAGELYVSVIQANEAFINSLESQMEAIKKAQADIENIHLEISKNYNS
ncbi:MAG TPA: hypothetical protein DCG75_11000 [Bacteroidales bacterium]|nr:hypothetical protein [Bacteroidales bacterium]